MLMAKGMLSGRGRERRSPSVGGGGRGLAREIFRVWGCGLGFREDDSLVSGSDFRVEGFCISVVDLWFVVSVVQVCGSGFQVQGSGFRVQGSGFRVQGCGFRVQGSGCRVQDPGFRFEGLGIEHEDKGVGLRVESLGCRVWRLAFRVEGLG